MAKSKFRPNITDDDFDYDYLPEDMQDEETTPSYPKKPIFNADDDFEDDFWC